MTPPHGTRSRYTAGCHCQPCRDANTAYQRAHRRERDPATFPHGTAFAYGNLGCRCGNCKEAQRIKMATYRARRRPQTPAPSPIKEEAT
jgi:hypothetical protein